MATAPRISNVGAKAMLDALTALMNGGTVDIRSGSAPTNVEDAATGTLLATLTLSGTAFGASADANPGAMATAAAVTDDSSADNTGTAGYFRAKGSGGTAVMQGTCGTAAADMILNSTSITAGYPVSISSWVIKMPELPGEAPGSG